MTERDENLAGVLDEFFPRRDEEHGDWDGVVTDARSNLRPRRSLAPTRRRRAVLALAVVAALTVLTVMPALAVSQGWWFLTDDAPKPTGPVVVAINPRPADAWALTAYLADNNGRTDICYSLTPSSEISSGGAMACGSNSLGEPNLPEESGATYAMISDFDFAPTSRFAFGPATLDVATVEVKLGDGSTVQARVFTAPKALGAPLRFYIVRFPANAELTRIIGRDSEGRVIGTITVRHWTKPPQES
jgi:hypothetical protein